MFSYCTYPVNTKDIDQIKFDQTVGNWVEYHWMSLAVQLDIIGNIASYGMLNFFVYLYTSKTT